MEKICDTRSYINNGPKEVSETVSHTSQIKKCKGDVSDQGWESDLLSRWPRINDEIKSCDDEVINM